MRDLDIPAVRTSIIIEIQWSDAPQELINEVREMWKDFPNMYNDNSYFKVDEYWTEDPDSIKSYPVLCKYLKGRGIKECLVHWWW